MLCLLDEMKAEAETLEKIASAPLPDLTSPIAPDADVFDATSLDKEMKSLLDISGSWALDMPDVLGDISVSDIRTLQPDSGKMLNDADGDKLSLYWYVMCASTTHPRYDFGHDPTFHDLVDRVAFGFSLQSIQRQMEKSIDVVVTKMTDELMGAISLSKTLKRRNANREEKAACVIQRLFTRKQRGMKQMVTAMSKATTADIGTKKIEPQGYITTFSHDTRTAQISTCLLDAGSSCTGLHYLSRETNEKWNPPRNKVISDDISCDFSLSPGAPGELKERALFINGFLRKIKDVETNDISSLGSFNFTTNDLLSCKRVREIFRPLLTKLDPSMFVELIHLRITSEQEALTNQYFVKLVMSIALSLSKSIVDTMGGKEAVIQASSLLYKHFAHDDILRMDELFFFLQDASTSGSSRVSALFLGRLLENVGEKNGKSGLHVVNSFVTSHQSNNKNKIEATTVPLPTFLKWLASLKPKLSVKEIDDMLSEIACPNDNKMISMLRFIQLCFPAAEYSISALRSKLAVIFSERVVGRTWLIQIVESCKEKDLQQSGFVGWKTFLEILDDMPVLLSASEANQLVSIVGGKASLGTKVKFSDLSHFIYG